MDEGNKEAEVDQHERLLSEIRALPWTRFIANEIVRGFAPEVNSESYSSRLYRIQTFMKTPRELEKTLAFGFLLCLDAFLYVFTMLPIRIITAAIYFLRKHTLHSYQISDILRGSIFIICCIFIRNLDISIVYHIVRGQSVIKLYVIYNILDILDKLLASFGQDLLDTLFWTTAQFKNRNGSIFHVLQYFIFSVIYVSVHTILILIQSVTLNVAVNSHNKALLTIIVSNQFVELKGSVFKRFDRFNLYQMSCADARERFQILYLICIVCLRNLTQFSNSSDYIWELVPDFLMVVTSEFLVDWVKHSFITKFNNITSEVYLDYREALAKDVAIGRRLDAHSHHSDLICRRMGFTPLPLGCLLYRVLVQSVTITGKMNLLLAVALYCLLIFVKIANSRFILARAVHYLKKAKEYRSRTDMRRDRYDSMSSMTSQCKSSTKHEANKVKEDTTVRHRSKQNIPLDKIDRYTLIGNRIV